MWNKVVELRNRHTSWGDIMKYTAEHAYPLTKRQLLFGLQQAGVDYVHHVIPWIEEAGREFLDDSLPALRYAEATLQSQAVAIARIETECNTLYEEYRTATPEARMAARTDWKELEHERYMMMTQYLTNLVSFRKALTDLMPAEMLRQRVEDEKGMVPTAAGAMQIQDQDVFWREARILERTVRRDFEIILAAVRRGENVPELRPLGPSDVEGESRVIEEEEPDEE